jgi:hypothetical protein
MRDRRQPIRNKVRFQKLIQQIDQANAEDPRTEQSGGKTVPKELLYSQRMTQWLHRLKPDASEALQIAVRAQHIQRWTIPRNEYPKNRNGYIKWRTRLARFHADTTTGFMRNLGYNETIIKRVASLLQKRNLKRDHEVQILEDVACLVFIENHLTDFSRKTAEEELIRIIRKTWKKMTPFGRQKVQDITLSPNSRKLLEKALSNIRL